MAVFAKKGDGTHGDESDFVRIPAGTHIGAGPDGRLMISFAGDMSFGESLTDLADLSCGRNLSLDAGVTLKADTVRVKATLELEAGAKLIAREIEAERVVSRKGEIQARTVSAGFVELEASRLTADRVTARDGVNLDRGEIEVGTVHAPTLTVSKGTVANIMVTEVGKLDGAISKGGYENFNEFLVKLLLYRPEVLNEKFLAEARRLAGPAGERAAANAAAESGEEIVADPALIARLGQESQRLRMAYAEREVPREITELLAALDGQRLAEVRRGLTPAYQRLQPQGKLPDGATEAFREIQRLLRDAPRARKEARPA